jgi:hypothetical protein
VTYVDGLDRENEISRLRAGTVVGEIEMLTGDRRVATVRAVTLVHALEIPKSALERLFAKSPDLIENLERRLPFVSRCWTRSLPTRAGRSGAGWWPGCARFSRRDLDDRTGERSAEQALRSSVSPALHIIPDEA